MTGPAVTIGPEEAVASAPRRMHDRGVKRLPVVDHAGALIGIVTLHQLTQPGGIADVGHWSTLAWTKAA
jgi:CBS domain-containing protein